MAIENENIVGFAGILITPDDAQITNIVTKKTERNSSIEMFRILATFFICITFLSAYANYNYVANTDETIIVTLICGSSTGAKPVNHACESNFRESNSAEPVLPATV